jgi:hypothetical protein
MMFMSPRSYTLAAMAMFACGLGAQVIQFESGGLRYQTLSKRGVTVMFAHLPAQLRDYSIVQAGIMNGSPAAQTIRPEDFSFRREDGTVIFALPARVVVDHLLAHARRDDVIKLISTYEMGLNGVSRFRSTNGYEQRRQSALAELGGNRLKAAAAASAIALVQTKLTPGESTDGAVFFQTDGRPLGPGHLLVRTAGQIFEFESIPEPPGKVLQQRSGASPQQN